MQIMSLTHETAIVSIQNYTRLSLKYLKYLYQLKIVVLAMYLY